MYPSTSNAPTTPKPTPSTSGYIDPGFFGSVLTLELHNSRQLQCIPLWPGMRIGQLICHAMTSPPTRTYALTGHYNRCPTVCASPPPTTATAGRPI